MKEEEHRVVTDQSKHVPATRQVAYIKKESKEEDDEFKTT